MKLVRWKRFTWDLSKLPPLETAPLAAQYHARPAAREDAKAVKEVIFSAFSLDTSWSDTFNTFREWLEMQIDTSFAQGALPPIVITHGQRVIAASTLLGDVDAESHLTSGPCVRVEYRNRGIGSALLHHSLRHLQQGGISFANGICKDATAANKFVYPKFGSTSVAYDFEPSVASH